MASDLNGLRSRDRIAGALFVVAIVFAQTCWLGRAVILLSVGLIIVYFAWAIAPWKAEPARVLPMYLVAIAVQCLHFAEEFATGFQRQFPRLLRSEWDDLHFVTFNLTWLALFVLAALGVYWRVRLAYLVVLFLAAIGGVGNGASHLLLSAMQHRYFPGAITAPICLLVGIGVLVRLFGKNSGELSSES